MIEGQVYHHIATSGARQWRHGRRRGGIDTAQHPPLSLFFPSLFSSSSLLILSFPTAIFLSLSLFLFNILPSEISSTLFSFSFALSHSLTAFRWLSTATILLFSFFSCLPLILLRSFLHCFFPHDLYTVFVLNRVFLFSPMFFFSPWFLKLLSKLALAKGGIEHTAAFSFAPFLSLRIESRR